jgi:CRP/FNR family transcriptional regulator, cyclic AMP receptor protein
MENDQVLERVPLFAGLDPRERAALGQGMRRRTFKRGDVLFHREDQGTLLYCIVSGVVRIFLPTGTGEEVTLDVLGPGTVFGELSLFDEQPRSASAAALEDLSVLTLDRTHVLATLSDYPRAMSRILAELSQRLRRANTMIEDIITLNVPGRVCKKLLDLSAGHGKPGDGGIVIGITFTQQELASMIGATRESTNKVLRNFQSRGLLRLDNRGCTILKPEALRRQLALSSPGLDF